MPAARVYLIDTILRGLPVPKIYLRTRIDVERQVSVREVVDGQQRLKAILDFAADKIRLTSTAKGGAAFDIAMSNRYPVALEAAARAVGFRGFGCYSRSGFSHVDLGPGRQLGERFLRIVSAAKNGTEG